MTLSEARKLSPGTKVLCDGRTYELGYIGGTGKVVVYEEGECNMQDATAFDPEDLELAPKT